MNISIIIFLSNFQKQLHNVATGLVTRALKRLNGTRVFSLNVVCSSFHMLGPQKLKSDLPISELTLGTLRVGKLLKRV